MRPISNLNSVSIRNYGPNYETLAVIKELKKLGIIKSVAKAKRQSKPKMIDEVKQPSDMVGYVKTLAGQGGAPNLFALRQIEPGMTPQQIKDITERNNAGVAALRAEVQQNRLEDLQRTFQAVTQLANLETERFRGAQEPGAGQRPSPFIQSTTIEDISDIQEGGEAFTQSLNEGGPKDAPIQPQTELFAETEEEEELIPTKPALLPREPIKEVGGGAAPRKKKILVLDQQDVANELGLGKIPTMRNSYAAVEDFYIALTDATGDERFSLDSKSQILAEIKKLLSQTGENLLK